MKGTGWLIALMLTSVACSSSGGSTSGDMMDANTGAVDMAATDATGTGDASASDDASTTDAYVINGVGTDVTLLDGTIWKYFDDRQDLLEVWRAPGYDDSKWKTGPSKFGYGKDGEVTTLTEHRVAYYFRTTFQVDDIAGVKQLVARYIVDDGCVAYLNGKELFRDNITPAVVTYATPADSSLAATAGPGVRAESEVVVKDTLDTHLLVKGQNVLAVEVHNVNSDSGDIGFALQLTLVR